MNRISCATQSLTLKEIKRVTIKIEGKTRRDAQMSVGVTDIRWGAAAHDSVAGTNGFEMLTLDRKVLPDAQEYGVGRGRLGQYHRSQRRDKRYGNDASGTWRYLCGGPRWMSVGLSGTRWMVDNKT